jgi:hypothetical protein
MTRPLDKRPFGETEKDTWMTFARVAGDPFPHDPERLRKIVEALLRRIERRNHREARYLLSHIHRLAGIEHRFPLHSAQEHATASASRQRLLKEADRLAKEILKSVDVDVLDVICNAGIPRSNHAADTVRLQRDLLTEFLRREPYPMIRTTRDEALKGWMRKNVSRIWKVLADLPCYCTYCESYRELLEADLSNCLGPAPLIDVILAKLHASSEAAIRKILSHTQTP